MQVIEIFLPLRRNDGSPQPPALFQDARRRPVEKFGGLPAYTRAPAQGFWERAKGAIDEDAIIIFEVIAENTDDAWWTSFRQHVEQAFAQRSIIIRAFAAQRL